MTTDQFWVIVMAGGFFLMAVYVIVDMVLRIFSRKSLIDVFSDGRRRR